MQAMQLLKQGEVVIAMDPRLKRSPASNKAVQKVLKLAFQCLAPVRRSRPSMKSCAEVLWEIRKDFTDRTSSHTHNASHHSANFPQRDGRKNRHKTYGMKMVKAINLYQHNQFHFGSLFIDCSDSEHLSTTALLCIIFLF